MILRYRQQQEGRTLYDVSSVGARIRTAREIRGLTQVQLAARLLPRRRKDGKLRRMVGWDVHGWETGERDLPYELLAPLCRALGVTEGWLLGDTDQGGPPMPRGLRVRQRLINWAYESRRVKDRAIAKAELERIRGLRGEGQRRIHHLKDGRPEAPLLPAAPLTPPEVPGAEDSGERETSP